MSITDPLFLRPKRTRLGALPLSYREHTRWIPRVGDVFPNFVAQTTHGEIDFYDWGADRWVLLSCFPTVRGGITATEMVSLASIAPDLERRNVKVMGVSALTLDEQHSWVDEIQKTFNIPVEFPVIDDSEHVLGKTLNLGNPRDSRLETVGYSSRKTFIIDSASKLRMIFEYPTHVGRSSEELLRVIDALVMMDVEDVAAPADWRRGDPGIVPPWLEDAEVTEKYGETVTFIAPFLRVVEPRVFKK